MTAIATPPSATPPSAAPTRVRPARSGVLVQVWVLTGRALRQLHDPRLILLSLLQPLIMLVLFSQVFRSIADSPGFPSGANYIDYLLPAILVTTGTQAAIWSGAGLAADLSNGALARFRTLPISMTSLLVARNLFDLVRNAIQLIVLTVAAAVLFGYAPAGGIPGTTLALLLGLAVATGLSWVFIALASWVRKVELMQMVGFIVIFPLMFASSAFVPITGLPPWLRVIATINPLTYAIDAARGWAMADPTSGATVSTLLIAAGLTVGAALIASRGVRRP
ncbi:MAG: ABC transporter permease [Pseudonocardiales bacterium]|nr:ABC transporter permease [Pseudonocardiales bacterium]MBV9728718.1 ABC transporter permease [Pseudonocardiales bacterium]